MLPSAGFGRNGGIVRPSISSCRHGKSYPTDADLAWYEDLARRRLDDKALDAWCQSLTQKVHTTHHATHSDRSFGQKGIRSFISSESGLDLSGADASFGLTARPKNFPLQPSLTHAESQYSAPATVIDPV
jgi:hypothetical protein